MTRPQWIRIAGCGAAILVSVLSLEARTSTVFRVSPTKSYGSIVVGKAGPLSAIAGHTHRVEVPTIDGTIKVDFDSVERSIVHIEIDTRRLTILRTHESDEDLAKIQRTMMSNQVLDVTRFPTITFDSSRVNVRGRHDASLDLTVAGELTLHGVTRSVAVPVRVDMRSGAVTAVGRLSVKQTDYGITPVTAAGVVKVRDTLAIDFTIVAEEHSPQSGE